jgi:hypothetical protein
MGMSRLVVAIQAADAAVDLMVKIQIIGAQIACSEGLKDTWREVAAFA